MGKNQYQLSQSTQRNVLDNLLLKFQIFKTLLDLISTNALNILYPKILHKNPAPGDRGLVQSGRKFGYGPYLQIYDALWPIGFSAFFGSQGMSVHWDVVFTNFGSIGANEVSKYAILNSATRSVIRLMIWHNIKIAISVRGAITLCHVCAVLLLCCYYYSLMKLRYCSKITRARHLTLVIQYLK